MELIDINKLKDFMSDDEIDIVKAALNMPTVEAIPIEWIKRWANSNCTYCYDYDYPTEKYDSWYAIRDMIDEWEKRSNITD